ARAQGNGAHRWRCRRRPDSHQVRRPQRSRHRAAHQAAGVAYGTSLRVPLSQHRARGHAHDGPVRGPAMSLPAALLTLLLALTVASSSAGEGGSSPPRPTADPGRAVSSPPDRAALIREQHLPNVELITHEGRTVRFYDDLVKGKVVAINFMFTRCARLCPTTTAKLITVQAELGERVGRDVFMYSITLDPTNDTPAVLNRYAQAFGAKPGWTFLTGKAEDITMLRRKLGVYDRDPLIDADLTKHSGLVVLGNEPRGRWRAIAALAEPVRIRQFIERTIQ